MTYDQARINDLLDRRDDAQSQLDALCGENPEVCADLIEQIASFNRSIREG